MKMLAKPVLCACLAAMLSPAAGFAQPPREHRQDGQARRNAAPVVSVREIESRIVPMVPGGQYLGFDYDPEASIYTLKFLRNGSVIVIDVDGRTGRIVRRVGI